jgi:plasmid stability protein
MNLDSALWYYFNTSMKSLHIRNLDEDTLSRLKNRAARHRRSLQKEVESLLIDAAQMAPADEASTPHPRLALKKVATGKSDAKWDRASIYDDDGR